MAKGDARKIAAKPSRKDQYERFQKAARDLGLDDEKSAQEFEETFCRIVPPQLPKTRRKRQ